MKIVRMLVWILVLTLVLIFSWANWDRQTIVRIWSDLIWDTRLPVVVIVSFLLGHVPMWLYSRGQRWSYSRRIRSLENAIRANALTINEAMPDADFPIGTGPA